MNQIREVYGKRQTFYLAGVFCHRPQQSTSIHSVSALTRRLPKCGQMLAASHRLRTASCSLWHFSPLTTDFISAVRQLPEKSSASDPIPTSVLKHIIDIVASFIAELFRGSTFLIYLRKRSLRLSRRNQDLTLPSTAIKMSDSQTLTRLLLLPTVARTSKNGGIVKTKESTSDWNVTQSIC